MAPQIVGAFDADAFAGIGEHDRRRRPNRYSGYDPSRDAADRRRAYLMKTIELEIIPKMVSARRDVQDRFSGAGSTVGFASRQSRLRSSLGRSWLRIYRHRSPISKIFCPRDCRWKPSVSIF